MQATTEKNVLERVKFPDVGYLGGDEIRHAKMKMAVAIFCKLGAVRTWDRYADGHFPTRYLVDEIEILYNPLGYSYSIRDMKFEIPKTEQDVLDVIQAVKVLQRHGLHF